MTIQEARAISYNEMVNMVNGRPLQLNGNEPIRAGYEEVHVVSITDHDLPKIFNEDTFNILTVVFSDIEAGSMEYEPKDGEHFLTSSEAKDIVEFIERAHLSDKKILLLVNCKFGMCRSGAVVDYAATRCALGCYDTQRRNPQILPNQWVKYQLFKEHFRSQFEKNNQP